MLAWCFEMKTRRRTSSPSRAIAGRRVGAASRWRSMPSKTSMNLPFPSRSCCSCTRNALMLSHLPSPVSTSSTPCFLRASCTEDKVRSSRCLVVMHSLDRMTADGISTASRTAWIMRLFPVASTPWTTMVDGLEMNSRVASWRIWSSLHGMRSFKESRSSSGSVDIVLSWKKGWVI